MDRKAHSVETQKTPGIAAAIISVGNELLLGKTINTNQAWLGEHLSHLGIEVAEVRVIPDTEEAIRATLDELWTRYDLVISTGGLGPTKDDITKHTVAKYFGKKMLFSESVWDYVQERFHRRGMETPPVNRCQAEYPEGFELLHNERGTAPGLLYEQNGKRLFLTPGVPSEMQGLFVTEIGPRLNVGKRPYFIRTIHTWNITESQIAEMFDDIAIPANVSLAYLPQTGRVSLRIYGSDVVAAEALAKEVERRMQGHIWGYDEETIPGRLHDALVKNGLTLALAESCTGGLAAATMTAIPGSSLYFLGGMVTYANRVKSELLGVNEETIIAHGAVSEETAMEMVTACRAKFHVDLAGAITGIAGPDGGTPEKPVGTVHIAIDLQDTPVHELLRLTGTRDGIRLMATERLFLRMLVMLGEINE